MATTPAIRDVRPVAFPPYTASRRIALFAPTPAEYAQAVGDRAFVMERVTYRSDDLDVYAYLYRPVAPPKDKKLPVVVFNRGSYVRDDFSYEVLMLANRLAHQGYFVIAPMLRGSGGAQGHDEMGGADLHDLINVVAVIKEIPYADPTRLFLYGESRGGIMSLLAETRFSRAGDRRVGAITDLGPVSPKAAPSASSRRLSGPVFPATRPNCDPGQPCGGRKKSTSPCSS